MTPLAVLRHTFPALDVTAPRLYRVRCEGSRRWHTISAHDSAGAIATAQAGGAVAEVQEITR